MICTPPYTMRPATGSEQLRVPYYVVLDSNGKIVAQGPREMCELVVIHGPLYAQEEGEIEW